MRSLLLMCAIVTALPIYGQPDKKDIDRVISEVNDLRKTGCYCGGRWMPPARPVSWDHELYIVSREYARYMYRNDHFSHFSKNGEDLGDRLDRMGYEWQKVGENIGHGYMDFYDVFEAWRRSPSHCEMLMDPDVTLMGMSKYYTYWVQSFSRPFTYQYGTE